MYARSHAYTPCTTYTLFEGYNLSLLTNYEVINAIVRPSVLPEPNLPINVTDVENGKFKILLLLGPKLIDL